MNEKLKLHDSLAKMPFDEFKKQVDIFRMDPHRWQIISKFRFVVVTDWKTKKVRKEPITIGIRFEDIKEDALKEMHKILVHNWRQENPDSDIDWVLKKQLPETVCMEGKKWRFGFLKI